MYAVVQTGGKQLRVTVGQSIQVEKLPGTKGDRVEFDRVLLLSRDDQTLVGSPLVEGATVIGTLSRQERGDKIIVFRYKSKKRVRVRKGHRQSLTRVFIRDILVNGASLLPPKPPKEAKPTVEATEAEASASAAATTAPEAAAAASEPTELATAEPEATAGPEAAAAETAGPTTAARSAQPEDNAPQTEAPAEEGSKPAAQTEGV